MQIFEINLSLVLSHTVVYEANLDKPCEVLNFGDDPPASSESMASILQAYRAYLPDLLKLTTAQILPTEQAKLAAAQSTDPGYLALQDALYRQYGPSLAATGSAINKQNALKYGIVSAKDASLMVDSLYITIKKSNLTKSDLAILDILSHYQWDRPIYVVSPGGEGDLGFSDYLEFDGFAYRIVPIKTARNPYSLDAGRVNTDVLYNNLMNKYRWSTMNDPKIYIDQNMNRTVVQVLRIRDMFSRLSAELIK